MDKEQYKDKEKEGCKCQKLKKIALGIAGVRKNAIFLKGSVPCLLLHCVFDGYDDKHLMEAGLVGSCFCPKCHRLLCEGCRYEPMSKGRKHEKRM